MKILFLTTHLNVGGVSTYVTTLAKHLKQKGVEVVCASAGGTLLSELDRNGIKHYTIPIQTKNELHIKLLFAFFKILEIIDKEGITHLHAHTRVAQVLGAVLKKIRNIEFITTCHGFFKRRLFRKIFPAWGDKIIAISDPVREHLVNDFKVSKSKISLVYNGVEPEKFEVNLSSFDKEELRRYYNVGEEGLIVGGISRLEKIKGYQSLIRCIPQVLAQHPKIKFVLIGEGKYKAKLMKLARKLDIEDKLVFTGKVEDVDVVLELIDIFVLPSVSSEGFGLAVLEAMAAGKPIIVSNLGGVYALVKEGVNGWLLPPGDISALATAINRLIEDPTLLKSMGENSRQIAREVFSIEKMTESIINVYKELEVERENKNKQ
ncbi:MAG: glycosyltransferase family 4 protein [Candidatus Omnitrophica bacterium]|nr:glycosyltransferase family 4 protein [Candidatus Omnitrophota bacterium]